MSGVGGFLQGMAGGINFSRGVKERQEQAARADERTQAMIDLADAMRTGPTGGYRAQGDGDGYYGGGYSHPPGNLRMATDPVATDMPGYQRAFLNAIALPESGGAYDVRYTPQGGARFEANGEHPRIFEPGPHGPSSAAGRYQFTATTWDDMGGGPFTEDMQDRRAWALAERDYRARTGGDLTEALLRDGVTPQLLRTMAPTWAGFNGDPGPIIGTYNDSLERYRDAARATNTGPQRPAQGPTQASAPRLPTLAETAGRGVGVQSDRSRMLIDHFYGGS